ncbi:C40 family peptidase [Sediminicola arcticus]|jgi:cell wall-associated NlpC family hydrolase|uniref:C40 family peptidase n=1 Tax=Sediminicola arcticus TaxID=1574308 RepID=A0ABV2SV61_9FLAO
MQYGICHLSIVPVRAIADDVSEMITQLLYGDHFKVLEHRKYWSKIRIAFDTTEGWVSNNQFLFVSEERYQQAQTSPNIKNTSDLVSFVSTETEVLIPIVIGSTIQNIDLISHYFEGNFISGISEKSTLLETALLYLNTPYLWGGKTPFGIDASGLTQMVYKINGYQLLRTASQQASQGEPLSFIEESEAGDLAFFDNNDGIINHVGIIMQNNYVIHAQGKVRIDRIDHTGIFNTETRSYTHQLRVIKKII